MRWPQESAITRRDANLARTRKLSARIAGGATAASLGLAAALGYALPGHLFSAGTPTSHAGSGGGHGSRGGASRQGGNGGLAPPQQPPQQQPPSGAVAPPVVPSGGS